MAEGAGVEPARPEGLAALASRCLAARPTLRCLLYHSGARHDGAGTSPRRDSNAQASIELRERDDAKVELAAGLKPAASRLGFGRSIRLSYAST